MTIGCFGRYEPQRSLKKTKPGKALCLNCSGQKTAPGSVLCTTCQPGTLATPETYVRRLERRPTDPKPAPRHRYRNRTTGNPHYSYTDPPRPVTLPHVSILDAVVPA